MAEEQYIRFAEQGGRGVYSQFKSAFRKNNPNIPKNEFEAAASKKWAQINQNI